MALYLGNERVGVRFTGVDGISPIANVEQTENGATITITDVNGTTTANIINGVDGYTPIKGKDYTDGYTPIKGKDYTDGSNSYIHIKYSADGGKTFSDVNNATHIGIYADFESTDSTDVTKYTWHQYSQDFSAFATKEYVDQNGGKIDLIKLNGVPQTITNKEVDLQIEVPEVDTSNLVTLSESQTITGAKTFSSALTVNNNITATGNITGAKVYNAIWNDYAEWFEKENLNDEFEAGDILAWSKNGVVKATNNNNCIVGVMSDTYGHILGGKELLNMEENHNWFVPVGLKGRVKCKVIGKVKIGDYIVPSCVPGKGEVMTHFNLSQIIGKSLEENNEENEKIITIMIGI